MINQEISESLMELGYTGSINDMLYNFYKDYGVASEYDWLYTKILERVSLNDLKYKHLKTLGYSGSLVDMLYNSLTDRTYFLSVASFFGNGEPGLWIDTYNPDDLYPRRNRLLYSQDFDNASWLKTGGGTGVAPVVTANAGTAPDGTLTADRIVFDKGIGTTSTDNSTLSVNGAVVGQLRGHATGQSLVGSIYLKTEDGSTKIMRFDFNGVHNNPDELITVTGDWQRFIIYLPAFAWPGNSRFPTLRLRANLPLSSGVSTDNTATVFAWGMQFEIGSSATEYQRVTDWQTEYAAGVDLSRVRLWQDSAGTIPVSMYEQPVGRVDSRVNGVSLIQATAGSRPTLSARYNILQSSEVLATQNVTTIASLYRFRFTGSGTVTFSGTATGARTEGVYNIICTAGTLTATVSGTVNFADLRLLADADLNIPVYQQTGNTTAAVDFDMKGFPPYLRFDGTDDWMSVALNFSGVNKITSWVGVTKRTDAAQAIVFELTANSATTAASFGLSAPSTGASGDFQFRSGGTVAGIAKTVTGHDSPITKVVTGVANISTPSVNLRVNGVEGAAVTTSQGTGNYANSTLYVGRRGGATLPLNGRIYSLIIRGETTSSVDVALVEKYVAYTTRVAL